MAQVLWQQRQDIGPMARSEHAMAYMTSRARTLLFGGGLAGGTLFGDSWEWDGDAWVQVADIGPGPRRAARAAYDKTRDLVVLFGGIDPNGKHLFDTWEWDGEAWTQIENVGPSPPQSPRWMQVVYDSARQVTLLEGGAVATGGNGTWTWEGTTWTQIEDTGVPKRHLGGLAFDPVRECAVAFGGFGAGPQETWEWDGSLWKRIEDVGPSGRWGLSMTWDGSTVLLFGGFPTASPPDAFGDTWTWDGKHWKQRQDIGPSPRGQCGIAWDEARDRVVLFGGCPKSGASHLSFGETWEAFEGP